jgi:hypothetical protein
VALSARGATLLGADGGFILGLVGPNVSMCVQRSCATAISMSAMAGRLGVSAEYNDGYSNTGYLALGVTQAVGRHVKLMVETQFFHDTDADGSDDSNFAMSVVGVRVHGQRAFLELGLLESLSFTTAGEFLGSFTTLGLDEAEEGHGILPWFGFGYRWP